MSICEMSETYSVAFELFRVMLLHIRELVYEIFLTLTA